MSPITSTDDEDSDDEDAGWDEGDSWQPGPSTPNPPKPSRTAVSAGGRRIEGMGSKGSRSGAACLRTSRYLRRGIICGGVLAIVVMGAAAYRYIADGGDGRMDALKPNFVRFLMTWTLQGLWVFLTASCALAAMTTATAVPLGGFAYFGATLWVIGFACEVVADHQKRVFRRDPANNGQFITSGLWAWSQHPNYFGEILLWFGIALIALPTLRGAQYATLISPIFVFVLLTHVLMG